MERTSIIVDSGAQCKWQMAHAGSTVSLHSPACGLLQAGPTVLVGGVKHVIVRLGLHYNLHSGFYS